MEAILFEILSTQAKSYRFFDMIKLIHSWLVRIEDVTYTVDNNFNIIVEKGGKKEKPLYACHTDTVHNICSKYSVREYKDKKGRACVTSSCGIGGDDKCGIYIGLKLLQSPEIKNIRVIFFANEEVGFVGSNNIDDSHLQGITFAIQGDRKGSGDIIDYTSKRFDKRIALINKRFGYKKAIGSVTDVISLHTDNRLNVSVMNVSVGYYNPHTKNEYIILSELYNAYHYIHAVFEALQYEKRFQKIYKPTVSSWDSYYYGGGLSYAAGGSSYAGGVYGYGTEKTRKRQVAAQIYYVVDASNLSDIELASKVFRETNISYFPSVVVIKRVRKLVKELRYSDAIGKITNIML